MCQFDMNSREWILRRQKTEDSEKYLVPLRYFPVSLFFPSFFSLPL